jgi:hypothetical protein
MRPSDRQQHMRFLIVRFKFEMLFLKIDDRGRGNWKVNKASDSLLMPTTA